MAVGNLFPEITIYKQDLSDLFIKYIPEYLIFHVLSSKSNSAVVKHYEIQKSIHL